MPVVLVWLVPVLEFLGAWLLRVIATGFIIKAAIGTFAVLLLPKVLKYVWLHWGSQLVDYALTQVGSLAGSSESLVINLTGMVGYVAGQLRIVDCFAVMISAWVTMFALSFVRK
jgi:hypothetical protein